MQLSVFKDETKTVWLQTVLVSYMVCLENGKIDILDIVEEVEYQRKKRVYDEVYPNMLFEKAAIQEFLLSSGHVFYADKLFNDCQNIILPKMGDRIILLGGAVS